MKYLIKNAKIVSKGSTYNGKKMDILVQNGVITEISRNIETDKATVVKSKNLHISVGWLDIGTHLGEPGHEHRETMKSLCNAALAGGFTDIAPFPNAAPTIQTKSQIISIINDGNTFGLSIHPIGALSTDTKGENIAEYMDMSAAGAVGFGDGLQSVQKNGLLLRALQYAKASNSVVIHHPIDESLANDNQLHEGLSSLKMGMKGSPVMAEHIMVDRDIQIQAYTESKLCMHAISSKKSIELIRNAKSEGLFASVAYLNLLANDEDMLDFDTNYKVKPVLREKSDQQALIKAAAKRQIDYICSNHTPLEPEAKVLEFSYAESGATGLETLYSALNTFTAANLDITDIIPLLTTGPRAVLGIANPKIEEGEQAKLTCWDPSINWSYTTANKKSKSANSPFLGKELEGKVLATFNGKHCYRADI